MSSDSIATTPFDADPAWSLIHCSLPRISSTQRNVIVRAGAGSAPRRMRVLHRERRGEQRAAAAGVVVRAGLLHVRGQHDALLRMRCGPGSRRPACDSGRRWNVRLDVDVHA